MSLNFVGEKRTKIHDNSASLEGSEIALRARLHHLRLQGKPVQLNAGNLIGFRI